MSCSNWSFTETLRATEEFIDVLKQRGEYDIPTVKLLSQLRDWWVNLQEIEHLAELRRHEPYSSDLLPIDLLEVPDPEWPAQSITEAAEEAQE